MPRQTEGRWHSFSWGICPLGGTRTMEIQQRNEIKALFRVVGKTPA